MRKEIHDIMLGARASSRQLMAVEIGPKVGTKTLARGLSLDACGPNSRGLFGSGIITRAARFNSIMNLDAGPAPSTTRGGL